MRKSLIPREYKGNQNLSSVNDTGASLTEDKFWSKAPLEGKSQSPPREKTRLALSTKKAYTKPTIHSLILSQRIVVELYTIISEGNILNIRVL